MVMEAIYESGTAEHVARSQRPPLTSNLDIKGPPLHDLTRLRRLAFTNPVLQPSNRLAYLFRALASSACVTENLMAAETFATTLLAEIRVGVGSNRRLYTEHQLDWYAERVDARGWARCPDANPNLCRVNFGERTIMGIQAAEGKRLTYRKPKSTSA